MKHLPTIIIIGLLIAGGWWTWSRLENESTKSRPKPPQTSEVDIGSIEDVVTAGGYVEPVISTEVRSEITGRIETIHIKDGEKVASGQVLLELEKTERLTELEEAKRLYEAQALRLEQAQRDYARLEDLRAKNFTNEKDFLDSKTELGLMKIELDVRQARLDKASENLAKTTIRAPHEGVVGNFDLNPGQVITGATSVNQGTTLMTINDLLKLHVRTKVNELDINKIKPDMAARITFDALPEEEFTGVVSQIFSYAESEGNERIFRVLVTFEAGDERIRPGISATVTLPIAEVHDVTVVIPTALFKSKEGFVAYKKKGEGQWEKVSVETGLSDVHHVEVKSGLDKGDVVSLTLPEGIGPSADS
ncbi:efflux RND transporter periplasmic adaptor subunit [Cerasicoccus arenae]|uniref:Secretion protein HlyD n=1 Tax=Cerasicoccus arenae TaxID=424488 RepID=A0A8J3GFF2_9BACT|nr:efflux RND transporter periplasmic adaptor subunit [Cerasicoccus arenae]MBK1856834.1 efflux RND transporter periplasmic adaptor subunit [Cerasicoccus arenae]GHC11159.1 secretion protein HlyD [Cerasicoccus arenae]